MAVVAGQVVLPVVSDDVVDVDDQLVGDMVRVVLVAVLGEGNIRFYWTINSPPPPYDPPAPDIGYPVSSAGILP